MTTSFPIVLRLAGAAALAAVLASGPAAAATQAALPSATLPQVNTSGATRALAAGPEYKAGPLHRWILGPGYRKLWTTPIKVEVLDLASFAGGLTPTKKGGGMQTKSLRFDAADGRRFRVRSVNKDPSPTLPPDLRDTFAEWVVQDQISTAHPAGPMVVDALVAAVGLLHVEKRFVVIPDDPRLGEFRKEFGGMLGIIEQDARIEPPVTPGFESVRKLIEGEEILKLVDASPADRVDARTFLKARLLDLLIGDWDRHIGQWDWAKVEGNALWQPYPTDRDQAFANFDGLLLTLVRPSQRRFVDFDQNYPDIVGLTWNGRYVDRRFLSELDRPDFMKAAEELKAALTDAVIETAARRMPTEYFKISGALLVERLKERRDDLPQVAEKYFAMLADQPEVHGTAIAEVAEIERAGEDAVTVTLRAAEGGEPHFRRTYRDADTSEIRVFLKGGDDRAVVRGSGDPIKVRVVGGPGADTLDDSAGGRAHFYDHEGQNRIVEGPGTEESDAAYVHPVDRRKNALRDWGRATIPLPWLTAGGDMGVFLGLDIQRYQYGFRRHPHASHQIFRGGYSTALQGGLAEYQGEFTHTNSRKRKRLQLRVSDVDVVRFHGFGNETTFGPSEFHKTQQRQFLASPSFRIGFDDPVDLSFGLVAKYTQPDLVPGTFLARTRPYGAEDFGQVGGGARLVIDRRNTPKAATRGALLLLGGNFYPQVWSVDENFGEAHGEMAGFLTAPIPGLRPTLAVRVGGKHLWGLYPYHEAAFVGGPDTVRGLRRQRYAGDASAFGQAELRLRLFDFKLLVPIDFGVFGLADAGRVFLEGEDSDDIHRAFGGGVSFTFLRPEYTVSIAAAKSPEEKRARLYIKGGYGF